MTEKQPQKQSHVLTAPQINLPKGGGAIKSIGEKFTANAVTGTGTQSIPILTSPGRAGFNPELSLSYDSGAGNGPFGLGWQLSTPSITRKTDKGLPKYQDNIASDEFILSGAEDLVPVDSAKPLTIENHTVTRYRPRIEGLFARIERWENNTNAADVHWRAISKENVLSIYGKDNNSRIVDPNDPTKIFSWLLAETRDDKGNAMLYHYKAEDNSNVPINAAHETSRGDLNSTLRTAQRYLKKIQYGNTVSLLDTDANRPHFLSKEQLTQNHWLFEIVFDYGEHDLNTPLPTESHTWPCRQDVFSSHRAGFEVRTYRKCQRILMFHHFPKETDVGANCLVNSTDFQYAESHRLTFLNSVTHCYYKRSDESYLKKTRPPIEFEYTKANVQQTVETIDPNSLRNLPIGLDGSQYRFVDLHGEGIPGILTEQANQWFYKRNLSPLHKKVCFDELETVKMKPNFGFSIANAQLVDVNQDGQVDLSVNIDETAGYFKHDSAEGWHPHDTLPANLNRNLGDPSIKLIDLNGDGKPDVLITEDEALIWHAGLSEKGYDATENLVQFLDEKQNPSLVIALDDESIYLADFNGDGLTDIVRIRRGEVCYWPNLGYGRFGKKITMSNVQAFDQADQFDYKQIQLADIDGSGTTDIIYLHRSGVRLYFNESGNQLSNAENLTVSPAVNDRVITQVTDLFGNGTACLVWSSPLPNNKQHQLQYVNLMGPQKPYLLVKTINNLGAETRVQYDTSTKFYLQDKQNGKPWITKLPFPVHVVERVDTIDHISRNRFVSRYAYHHGYYDGEEREFRGFGMVEQQDSEEITALKNDATFSPDNESIETHVPPTLTKTWFHTGAFLDANRISIYFSDKEYFQSQHLLKDTVFPDENLSIAELKEASRSLKSMMLRQELYTLDDSDKAHIPYSVTEQNFKIKRLQAKGDHHHAVFLTHEHETLNMHYERNVQDPRIQHKLTLSVDNYGNILTSVDIVYGRQQADASLPLQIDKDKQTTTHIILTENTVTNAIDDPQNFRTPLAAEIKTYEVTQLTKHKTLYQTDDFSKTHQKRLIEHVCTLYRPDDLGVAKQSPTALLPLATVESKSIPGEIYKLALSDALRQMHYKRNNNDLVTDHMLLEGGYVSGAQLKTHGGFSNDYLDKDFWIPSGKTFFADNSKDTATKELAFSKTHFFIPHRIRSPFHTTLKPQESTVSFDQYALLMQETIDPLGNRMTAGERDTAGKLTKDGNDYRVLQPTLLMDENRNRQALAFDVYGQVVATATMGKPEEQLGDTLNNFISDISDMDKQSYLNNPLQQPETLIQETTACMLYDLHTYYRTKNTANPKPIQVYTITRETHASDLINNQQSRFFHAFSYSDGFGREIQQKIQAENNQWVASGWSIFNNKGKPVRSYEPFFTNTHDFEFGVTVGVSPILFYDPLNRAIATLHPDNTYEKVVFGAWQQSSWDNNDTVLLDPRTDPDIAKLTKPYFDSMPKTWKTWYQQHKSNTSNPNLQTAAKQTEKHAGTANTVYLDSLGRPFLSIANNGEDAQGNAQRYTQRTELDIEGNERIIRDAIKQNNDPKGRIVMQYDYDLLGNQIHQLSQEAGERWLLNDITGQPLYAWDSKGNTIRTVYDNLRRPTETYLTKPNSTQTVCIEKNLYGESHPQAETLNLRGELYFSLDQAGLDINESFDFKSNALSALKRLAKSYKQTINWPTQFNLQNYLTILNPLLETEIYQTQTSYDALNRPRIMTTPHSQTMKPNRIKPIYNEAKLLEKVLVNHQDAQQNGDLVWTHFVNHIDYDAKGQRERIDYGNGTHTEYEYDPLTYRLTRLLTKRQNDVMQDLHYTHDPVGNITHITDKSQQILYFRNHKIDPSCQYTYDPLYRLIEATGREHLGQLNQTMLPHNHHDDTRSLSLASSDGNAMAAYTESYVYDAVGNILQMQHRGKQSTHAGWTRNYQYNETSLTESQKTNNRLSNTSIGTQTDTYQYDDHGNMTHLPHLSNTTNNCIWNYKDQLIMLDLGGGGKVYYTYDSEGDRVRKVWEKSANTIEERFYLGEFEIYRKRKNNQIVTEKETLHIIDDENRIALIETRTINTLNESGANKLIRYQYNNHLGSASLELDHQGQIISYEEYSPYGNTVFQAVRNQTETKKRYRFTGKERDNESGFYYHGARYYLPWLGKWLSSDPEISINTENNTKNPDLKLQLILNAYSYSNNNPTRFHDPDGRAPADKGVTKAIQLAKRFIREFGKRGSNLVARKASDNAMTRLLAKGIPENIQHHIALHFTEDLTKNSHTVFREQFQNMGSVLKFLKETLSKPSTKPILSRTDDGRIAWIFERSYKKTIGTAYDKVKDSNNVEQIVTTAVNKMRVVVDLRGNIVTAFPIKSFTKTIVTKGGLRVTKALKNFAVGLTLSQLYSKEAKAKESAEAAFDKVNNATSWYEWLLPFEISRIGYEPSPSKVRKRATDLIQKLENQTGTKLTDKQKAQIRSDVSSIWY